MTKEQKLKLINLARYDIAEDIAKLEAEFGEFAFSATMKLAEADLELRRMAQAVAMCL